MIAWNKGTIWLRHINNRQGRYTFLHFNTSQVVTRQNLTEISILEEVIGRVSTISNYKRQPNDLTFPDRNRNTNYNNADTASITSDTWV